MIETLRSIHFLPTVSAGSTVIMAMIASAFVWWVKGAPERRRAATEATKQDQDGESLLRHDLTEQIKELRMERAKDREDIMRLSTRLGAVEAENRRRGDKINNLTFIIQLVMNELQRLDPNSIILGQAARLLIQIQQPLDPNPATTLRDLARIDAAENDKSETLKAAEDTRECAEETVQQVRRDEQD